jgi:26S proteasome regulatory subunit N2
LLIKIQDANDAKDEGEGDVEMKVEDSSSPAKDGDVSPIDRSVTDLADENKPSTSATKSTKKIEPSFESRPNFSRVTPTQLAHVIFPSDGRYQPVRAVSTNTTPKSGKHAGPATSERYAGGGGILILADLRPEEEGDFIEFEPPVVSAPASADVPNGHPAPAPPAGPHIALDESLPEADPPGSFEVGHGLYDGN